MYDWAGNVTTEKQKSNPIPTARKKEEKDIDDKRLKQPWSLCKINTLKSILTPGRRQSVIFIPAWVPLFIFSISLSSSREIQLLVYNSLELGPKEIPKLAGRTSYAAPPLIFLPIYAFLNQTPMLLCYLNVYNFPS
ncbi:hypothetical protein [Taibaiella helva]|uniref:hypothetical protein n=1 Tax=Taibaiella helva TaxID=2301235 RepID=UPI0018E4F00D|nr:hypothetical protein [Taibaiella helva]